METVVVALITALFGPICVEWVRNKVKKKHDVVAEAIVSNGEIDHQLDLIAEEIKCDRIWIAQFHNGGHFYPTGKSIKKFSIFYEQTSADSFIKDTFQNIPVSLFAKSLSRLHKENEVVIKDCTNLKGNYDFSPFMHETKSKSLILISIDDIEGNLIGIMAIEYIVKQHELDLVEWIFLRQKIGVIGSLLDNYLRSKK